MNNGTKGNSNAARIELLKQKLEKHRAALAAEQLKLAKQNQRESEKMQSIIGAAVLKVAAASSDFKLMIIQTALANVSDEKQRQFLADRGWNV
jgi:hypothetical protein